jgi:surfactin synthase thioesterase subunit
MLDRYKTPWLVNNPSESDKLRIFCFPYAGGGASVFRTWKNYFDQKTGIYPVQLPGRENRIGEKPFSDMDLLVSELADELLRYMDRPFILFGHSIGARIAFEFARKLRSISARCPECLIVAGSRSPEIPEPKPLHHLDNENFINELKRFSGTPEAVLENKELMDLFVPVLRADFAIDETWKFRDEKPFAFPVYVFGGTRDREADYEELCKWSNHTTDKFFIEMLEGGHFFINDQRELLLKQILEIVDKKRAAQIIN